MNRTIFIGTEKVQATILDNNQAMIASIPLNPKYNLEDVVLIDDDLNVKQVIKKNNNRISFTFDMPLNDGNILKTSSRRVKEHFQNMGFSIKENVPGMVTISYPSGIPREMATAVADSCPVKLLIFNE